MPCTQRTTHTPQILCITVFAEDEEADARTLLQDGNASLRRSSATAKDAGVDHDRPLSRGDVIASCMLPLHFVSAGLRALPLQNPRDGATIAGASVMCDITFE